MEVQHAQDGNWHFKLGPVERWVVGLGAFVLVSVCGLGVNSFKDQQAKQGDTMQTLVTQMAVANGQLATLSTQLADVPALTRQMAEIKVRVDRLEQDTKDMRATRGGR